MYCTQCGTRLADTARYCTSCGKPTGVASHPATANAAFDPAAEAPRKLRRIRDGKKIAGVCAGFAEYFGTGVTTMRAVWVALTLLPPHIGLIGYIASWAVLPKPQ